MAAALDSMPGLNGGTHGAAEIHAGNDLSVQIRFRKGLLADWAGIKSGVRVLLFDASATAKRISVQ